MLNNVTSVSCFRTTKPAPHLDKYVNLFLLSSKGLLLYKLANCWSFFGGFFGQKREGTCNSDTTGFKTVDITV